MRGTYRYAPMKLMLAKIVKEKAVDPQSETPDQDVFGFVEGNYVQHSLCELELPAISAGEYFIISKVEWEPTNTLHKTVLSIYAPEPINFKRVAISKFPFNVYARMDSYLQLRLQKDAEYVAPSFATQ